MRARHNTVQTRVHRQGAHPQGRRFALDRLEPRLVLGCQIRFDRQRIILAMAFDHRPGRRRFELGGLARVPLLRLLALLGNLTPSMANISRPISPCA